MIIKRSNNGKFPLVLLHGWGVNSAVWDFVHEPLEQWFDVVCIDLPGFGVNHQHLPEHYSLDALAQMVAPHCPQGSIIAGWSLGGLVAAKVALINQDAVAGVCLIASSPRFVEGEQWKGVKPDVLEQFSVQLSQNMEKTVERFLAIQAMGSESARKDIKALKEALIEHPPANPDALAAGLSILHDTDLREHLLELKLPVKGLFGRLDSLVAMKSIEQWAPTMPDFQYHVLHKASHAPFISHRDEFVEQFYQLHRAVLQAN